MNCAFVAYEQICPSDGFGIVMADHFAKLSIPLLSLASYSDQESQRNRYLERGWICCDVLDLNEYWQLVESEEERLRLESLESFDEFEGLHSKCAHYVILVATKGSCISMKLLPSTPVTRSQVTVEESTEETIVKECDYVGVSWSLNRCSLERFGHAGAALDGRVWICGGFGSRRSGGHARLDDLVRLNQSGDEVQVLLHQRSLARIFHTMDSVRTSGGRSLLVVYGGRTQPADALSSIIVIDPETVSLMEASVESGVSPVARWRHASVTLAAGCGGILVSGGRNLRSVLKDCWILSVDDTGRVDWQETLPLPYPRHSHSLSACPGGIVLFGGLDRNHKCVSDLLILHDDDRKSGIGFWRGIDWKGPQPVARYSHRAVCQAHHFLIVGGVWTVPGTPPGVCIINLEAGTFREFPMPV